MFAETNNMNYLEKKFLNEIIDGVIADIGNWGEYGGMNRESQKETAQQCAQICEEVSVEFLWWYETSKEASDYLKTKRFQPTMDGSEVPKIKQAYKEIFTLFLNQKQEHGK